MKSNDELKESTSQDVRKRLTINELRQFKGLENLTDDEAEYTIDCLEIFAIVSYSIYNSKILKNEKSFDEV